MLPACAARPQNVEDRRVFFALSVGDPLLVRRMVYQMGGLTMALESGVISGMSHNAAAPYRKVVEYLDRNQHLVNELRLEMSK